ncbi:DUF262 domain-containing HNH endonuclease family protein [Lysobacter capsici]|uniref:DUF262 domain-containing protein n=1 Tax=Lysobacter capsici TaxID=435897 RepID=UPI001784B1B5|nr:DUF262 domain-containing protein [Lysobacter capsici]UOF13257.1 DUF262 domain-containing HNH endonuclease family protein [Lysobacter capsici]
MAYVTPQSQNLKVAFSSRYSLPHFQREYKWEPRHYEELINDIQDAFLQSFDPGHGRSQVADYSPYFLGSVITSSESAGKKPLIDGQQRLTSAFVLLAYLDRYSREKGITAAADLQNYLGSVSFGVRDYVIGFSDARRQIFDYYLDVTKTAVEALDAAEEINDLDHGDRRIIEALRATEPLLDQRSFDYIAYFIDFVIERVYLIDISVAKESEAHRVFVTMNDRGLRLGPIDLLKGEILSRVHTAAEVEVAHKAWVETVNKLRAIDPEEDSLFFRNFFRAQWGETIRGKSKGDAAGDYDIIGDAYHRWFTENTARIGLKTADDYLSFARDQITKFAEVYIFIREAEETLSAGFDHVYYNSARRYSFQSMVLLAAVAESDKGSEWRRKIALVSRLIDLILTTRTIEGKENNYDNLKELSFGLAKEVRGKDVAGIEALVRDHWGRYAPIIPRLAELSYNYRNDNRSHLLYVLSRIACYLETSCDLVGAVGFETYWRRDKSSRTFDIEHLLKFQFDPATLPAAHGFADQRDYSDQRNRIGALALLPRSRNRSLQAKPYREKLAVYANENLLVQTLDSGVYTNNPKFAEFLTDNPLVTFGPIAKFSKADISTRAAAYAEVGRLIWQSP